MGRPRIDPANRPIFKKYGRDHVAPRAIRAHAEARTLCVGKEIAFPEARVSALDQEWQSKIRSRVQRYSGLAYEFISYDLILDGWLEMPPSPAITEISQLKSIDPLLRTLLAECEEAAIQNANVAILPLVEKVRVYLDAYRAAILSRFELCGILWTPDQGDQ